MTERSGERFDRIRADTFQKKISGDSGKAGWRRDRTGTASSGEISDREIYNGA